MTLRSVILAATEIEIVGIITVIMIVVCSSIEPNTSKKSEGSNSTVSSISPSTGVARLVVTFCA